MGRWGLAGLKNIVIRDIEQAKENLVIRGVTKKLAVNETGQLEVLIK